MMGLGYTEMIIVGIVAVLLFGRKLPDVARSLGSSYRQFKQGLTDLQSQVNFHDLDPMSPPSSSTKSHTSFDEDDYTDEVTVPKFQPPPDDAQPADSQASSSPAGDSKSSE